MLRHTAASACRPFSMLPQGTLSMVWPRSSHQALAMPSMSSAAHSTNIKGFQKLNLSAKCAPASWPGAFLLSSSLPRLPIYYLLQALLHRWLAHKKHRRNSGTGQPQPAIPNNSKNQGLKNLIIIHTPQVNTGKPVLPPGRSSFRQGWELFTGGRQAPQRSAFRPPGESGRPKAGHPPFQTGTDVLL